MNMESIVDNTLVALMEQYEAAAPKLTIAFVVVVALIVIVRLVQAILAGALARGRATPFSGIFCWAWCSAGLP